jgi:hypothetical protein
MGGYNSKIDYYNIKSIIGPKIINNKLNEYDITYNNGKNKIIRFTKDKEREFKNIYEHSLILKPIVFIKYSKINKIVNFKIFTDLETNKIINDDIYSFDIIYIDNIHNIDNTDNASQTIRINKYQEEIFWKLFKKINLKKYNVCKNVLKILNSNH